MENKTIDIEPRAAVEMQTWTNIYDRVPSQYKQYVSYPTTAMNECPSKSEIKDKFPESTKGSPGNDNSQWIFPDEHLDAQAGNYLLTVSQTYKLYLVSVFYIVQ